MNSAQIGLAVIIFSNSPQSRTSLDVTRLLFSYVLTYVIVKTILDNKF